MRDRSLAQEQFRRESTLVQTVSTKPEILLPLTQDIVVRARATAAHHRALKVVRARILGEYLQGAGRTLRLQGK